MGRVDIRARRGVTLRQVFPLSEPIDAARFAPRCQIRLSPGSPVLLTPDVAIQMVSASALAAAGWATSVDVQCLVVGLSAAASLGATWPEALYDVELFTPGDETVLPLLSGRIYLDREVTQ